jgi:hypothetical protein
MMSQDHVFQLVFAKLAMDYYVVGRMAAMAHLMPVHGNLLHHAVELFLKTALVGTIPVEQMKKTPYSHDLRELWRAFKLRHTNPAFGRFDDTVDALHRFEYIRYPDKIVDQGILTTIQWTRSTFATVTGTGSGSRPLPVYDFVIEEVDHLIVEILQSASLNPKLLSAGVQHPRALEALEHNNPEAAKW